MGVKKRKRRTNKQSNSSTQINSDEHKIDYAKPRRSHWRKKSCHHNIPGLPNDIILDIISRLPLKLIIACKFLSTTFKNLISGPSFSHIYLTNNKSNSFYAISLDVSKPDCSLDLLEYDRKGYYNVIGNRKFIKGKIFDTERLPGGSSSSCDLFSVVGYCNGLLCLLKLEFGFYNLFVINPMLGEFVQLPKHVVSDDYKIHKKIFFSYGLGYCEVSNIYKVLRVVTEHLTESNCKTNSEIFTIGSDQSWRSLSDVNVPYNIKWDYQHINPQPIMIPVHSALHWIVQRVPISPYIMLKPNWGATVCICAFDVNEEKAREIQLLSEMVVNPPCFSGLGVLLDKLCWMRKWRFPSVDFWVMDEYGVEGSWTKKLKLERSSVRESILYVPLIPLTVLPKGVILLSNYVGISVFFDIKRNNCVRVIRRSKVTSHLIPLVPSFVSLGNLVQNSELMTNVQPCSLVFEEAEPGLSNDQLQLTHGPGIKD